MRPILIGLAAAATVGLGLCAPTLSVAGDYGYGYGVGGYAENVRRDGNVSYNAYNSHDGYARGRLGYWERPGDRYYGYGRGYGRGYGYDRDRDDCRRDERHDERRRCSDDRDANEALIPGYGYSADAARHHERQRHERRRGRECSEAYTDGERPICR